MHINDTAKRIKNFWLLYDGREDQKESRTDTLQADDVNFIMCSIFGLVALATLIIFSIVALARQEISYAFTLFSFALTTIIGLGCIWITGADWLAKHFTTLLMAILCIYFFYTGGTNGTGPVILLIFPSVALFLQGNVVGPYSVLSLLLLVLGIYLFSPFGFDNSQYSPSLISRVLIVFVVVSMLSYAFAFFKDKAEKDFLSSQLELEKGIIEDPETGLANRALLEKLLQIESERCKIYQRPGSLITIKLEIELTNQYKYLRNNKRLVYKNIRKIFDKVLRKADVPGHWSKNQLIIILPETKLEMALELSKKISSIFKNYNKLFDDPTVDVRTNITAEEIPIEE
ncbi:GGDEF domain-containing protein [Gammaproteobacteria bacterium]|nr:GGDEF domain-containing protein [Gammaproteobacteria bacterium]